MIRSRVRVGLGVWLVWTPTVSAAAALIAVKGVVPMSQAPEKASGPSSVQALALFEKGNEAALKSNFDYAVQMYLDALKIEPGNLRFRQSLRAAERLRYENDPGKVGWKAASKSKMARPGISLAKSRGKWSEVLDLCEDVFKYHPWDVHVSRDAAEAAEHLGQPALAKWYLELVFAQAGDDPAFFRHLAQTYELNKDWERAIHCWERVQKKDPTDDEARRKIKGLTANATITRSGLEDAVNKAPSGLSGPEQDAQPDLEELKRLAMTPEQRLRQQIQEEPQRVGPYLELADILKHQNKLDDAERILAEGRKATDDDPILHEAHADVQLSRLQRAAASYEKRLKTDPNDLHSRDKLAQITAKLQEYELREFKRRVEHRPEDAALRLQFGMRLAKAGRPDEAIAEFQQARGAAAANLKLQALYQLGLCFEAKNLPKLAERNYQEALKLVEKDGEQSMINALHYRLGRAAESHGDKKAAEEHYNEVAANDYTYEDVAQRLENLNRADGM